MRFVIIFFAIILNGTLLSAQVKFHSTNSLNVSVIMEDGIPHVRWETPREINTSYFIIERADTGQLFSSITTTKASGYAQFSNSYLYVDEVAPHLYCHYRVTLVMMDGTRISAEPVQKIKPSNNIKTKVLAAE